VHDKHYEDSVWSNGEEKESRKKKRVRGEVRDGSFSGERRGNILLGLHGLAIRAVRKCRRYRTASSGRFEVFTAVTMKNGVFWDITPCGSCKNQRFRGT
jgi:hypothetical protein